MKNVVRLAIVDPQDATRGSLKNLLLGIDTVWLEAECSRYEFFSDVVGQTKPDIALVSLDADAARGLALVSQLSQEAPQCSVLVISSSQEGSLILQAMRNGAREFLSFPLKLDDFLAALDRIDASGGGRSSEGQVRGSQVITVAGAGGGVGCTSLAINLACSLAANPRHSVAVIDLDLALGAVLLLLNAGLSLHHSGCRRKHHAAGLLTAQTFAHPARLWCVPAAPTGTD